MYSAKLMKNHKGGNDMGNRVDLAIAEAGEAVEHTMNKSIVSHTPGPWTVTEIGTIEDDSHNPVQLAAVSPVNRDANAKLIAAAPEMLAKLRELYDYFVHEADSCAGKDKEREMLTKAAEITEVLDKAGAL